jgi:hypothetical protein
MAQTTATLEIVCETQQEYDAAKAYASAHGDEEHFGAPVFDDENWKITLTKTAAREDWT